MIPGLRLPAHALLSVLVAAVAVVGVALPAQATGDGHRDGVDAHQVSDTTATISNTTTTSTSTAGTHPSTSAATGTTRGPLPGTPSLADSGLQTGACDPQNYPGGYSATLAVPAPCIQPTGCYAGAATGNSAIVGDCPPAQQNQPKAPVITTQMVTAAAQVVAPVNPPHVQPGTVSYVHIPNNYWADAPAVNDSVTLLGVTIPLRWTPTGTTWDFGDGATASGNGVEGAEVGGAGAVEHAYDRQGSYAISTTTTYDLTFVLPGGGRQTIALTAPPSPPVTLPIREIQSLANYAS